MLNTMKATMQTAPLMPSAVAKDVPVTAAAAKEPSRCCQQQQQLIDEARVA
jgi:hypothetical protein